MDCYAQKVEIKVWYGSTAIIFVWSKDDKNLENLIALG